MSRLLKRCTACKEYTLQETCVHCGGRAIVNRPPKYGPEDPYGSYRRRLKRLDAEGKAAKGGQGTGPADDAGQAAKAQARSDAQAEDAKAAQAEDAKATEGQDA